MRVETWCHKCRRPVAAVANRSDTLSLSTVFVAECHGATDSVLVDARHHGVMPRLEFFKHHKPNFYEYRRPSIRELLTGERA